MNAFNEKINDIHAAGSDLPAPTETYVWRYNPRDLLDEAIIGVILLAVCVAGSLLLKSHGWFAWLLMLPAAAYWLWLAYTLFVRRLCTLYKLTPQNFIYQRGFLVQKTMYVELFDIDQVNLKRNLWERIIGVGTIRLRVKLSSGTEDVIEGDEKLKAAKNGYLEINLPGMTDYENVRNLIDDYRLYVRQKRGVRISS